VVNVNKLRGKMVEQSITIEFLANLLDIDRSTLYRKLNNQGETLTIKEANIIAMQLKLNKSEINQIFFAQKVAQYATNCLYK
jgi:hypothetical protein